MRPTQWGRSITMRTLALVALPTVMPPAPERRSTAVTWALEASSQRMVSPVRRMCAAIRPVTHRYQHRMVGATGLPAAAHARRSSGRKEHKAALGGSILPLALLEGA